MALDPKLDGAPSHASFDSAIVEAQRRHALALVSFVDEGRPLGHRLVKETLSDPAVLAAARSFVRSRVDPDAAPDLFARLVGGRGALACCVIDGEQDVVSVLVGFAGAAAFCGFLDRARGGYVALERARRRARADADPAVLLTLARAYDDLGSPRRAAAMYDATVRLAGAAPTGAAIEPAFWAHERRARRFVEDGRAVEARAALAAARTLDPSGRLGGADRLALTAALVLAVERRVREARAALEQALWTYGSSDERDRMLLARAACEHELGDDAAARATLERLLREQPASAWRDAARAQLAHVENPEPDHAH